MNGDDLYACYPVPKVLWIQGDPLEVLHLRRRILRGLLDVAILLAKERGRIPSAFIGKPVVVPADEEPNVPVEGDRAEWIVVKQRFSTTVDRRDNGSRLHD